MPRFVAFLRAINVGGHTVRMDALRRAFEDWGASRVETFIASGNVIFDTTKRSAIALEQSIEAHLLDRLGFAVTTFLRSISELEAVAAHTPFDPHLDDGATRFVGFMKTAPDAAAVRAVASIRTAVDEFAIHGRELYWLRRADLMQSMASPPRLEKVVKGPLTMRNVTTVRRLASKYGRAKRSSAVDGHAP